MGRRTFFDSSTFPNAEILSYLYSKSTLLPIPKFLNFRCSNFEKNCFSFVTTQGLPYQDFTQEAADLVCGIGGRRGLRGGAEKSVDEVFPGRP